MLFNGAPGPMIYATRDQLSSVAPWSLTGLPGLDALYSYVEIERDGQLSNILAYKYATAGLQLFTLDQSGTGQAAVVNEDGTINGRDNPAPRGSFVSVFGTGGGKTAPAQDDGELVPGHEPFPRLPVAYQVTVGGVNTEVSYAGAAPLAIAGLVQVNLRIPQNVNPGAAAPLRVVYGPNANTVTIAVK